MPFLIGGTEDRTACIYMSAHLKYRLPGAGVPDEFGTGGCKVLKKRIEKGRATPRLENRND